MNRNKLKTYAPQARRDFIQAVTDRAAHFGLSAKKTEPMTEQGDVVLIAGKPFPKAVGEKRKKLAARIQKNGFGPTMEAVAFTWFNRLVALRYMELHEYLEHGYRVLSNPAGHSQPELLEHAEHVDLAGLDKQIVIALKLEGTKEEELYRHVFLAQCNALNKAMPFLFAKIDDETELLLPDNLLHSDSLIRKLVNEIDEEDWQQVEIIGWLYQFYISERKDEVIGKVVASEDIPAATQLFTPNWIVKFLVQNTLGRQWVATTPASPLVKKPVDENDKHYFMEYYIEPAEQTPEVQEQLKAITPSNLNPEELTLLDPACGSGHILVEAYDLFKAIYQERGYRAKDIPALILNKNLFGLEIDDRAAQLAAFALMMKARADDRRIFDGDAKPNVLSLQDSKGLDAADITFALNAPINKDDIPKEYLFEEIQDEKDGLFSKKMLGEKGHVSQADIAMLLSLFEHAKTFGSLIQISLALAAKLPEIEQRLALVLKSGDLTHASAHVLKPLLKQARFLARQYDAVVANPPYMGSRYFSPTIKDFVANEYKDAKADLYACFIQRNMQLVAHNGFIGMITIPNWMFLSSFEPVRKALLNERTIDSFVHNGRGVFGSDFGTCSFAIRNCALPRYRGEFRRLFTKQGSVSGNEELRQQFFTGKRFHVGTSDFKVIPGEPIAYWVAPAIRNIFAQAPAITAVATPRQGLASADNGRFLRRWYEVSVTDTGFGFANRESAKQSELRWFPHSKGGEFRKWYGNNEYVVEWKNDGEAMRSFERAVVRNPEYYFKEGVTWSHTSIATMSVRYVPVGFTFNCEGPTLFSQTPKLLLGYMCSKVCAYLMEIMNPTLHFLVGTVSLLPYAPDKAATIRCLVEPVVEQLIANAKCDWDSLETSWEFQSSPVLQLKKASVQDSLGSVLEASQSRIARTKELEEENNRLFIEAYGLQDELSPEVPDDQITLYRPDREEDIKRLLSYAIGCMMGRYSLDKLGLIYAHNGNQGFDPSQYTTFRADDDGILPLFDTDWGIRDDATNRFVEFIGVAWPKEHLEENLKFVADSLVPNNGEQPRDTIRRYFATAFYKHHLSIYKKRPIYWLFSSGKQRAFQCLVYLHRYNDGTLARMRTEYVIPLLGKLTARIAQLNDDIPAATSGQQRKRLEKEKDTASKQLVELQGFDEKLRHYADQRTKLDLDDGVKVNYGKFSDPKYGDILAEVKAICGTKDEE